MSRVDKILSTLSSNVDGAFENPFHISRESLDSLKGDVCEVGKKSISREREIQKSSSNTGLNSTHNSRSPEATYGSIIDRANDGAVSPKTLTKRSRELKLAMNKDESTPPSAMRVNASAPPQGSVPLPLSSMSPEPLPSPAYRSESEKDRRAEKIMSRIEEYMSTSKNDRANKEGKESLTTFVDKKRQLFLLQHSLNIKQNEIKKLGKYLRAKEQALIKSEEALEKDTLKFDEYLKDNDKRSREAVRNAEKVCKKRMDRVQDRKKMNQALIEMQSGINKGKSGLEECLVYKVFLEKLTPSEWFIEQKEEKKRRQVARRRKRIDARKKDWKCMMEKERAQREEELKKQQQKEKGGRRKGRRKGGRGNKSNRTRENIPNAECEEQVEKRAPIATMPNFSEEEDLTSSDEEMPSYFHKPKQLLDIFSILEEENLFLIQNIQEAEQSLDEMTERFSESRSEVQQKADTMQDNINQIKKDIRTKQDYIDVIRQRMEGKQVNVDNGSLGNNRGDSGMSGSQNMEQNLMHKLTKKVTEAYLACGFTFAGTAPSMLFMLAEIEERMENSISRLEKMPEGEFKCANKAKEKKRREAKRAQQHEEQLRLQEERNRKVIERSMQPPKKRPGKKIMYRMQPVQKKKVKEKKVEISQDELDQMKFLSDD